MARGDVARGGALHEIAKVLGISCGDVHRLIRERVPPADLRSELDRFKAELRAGGLKESTVHAYLLGSSLFVRWLAGDYVPGPGYSGRARAFTAEERS